MANESDAGLAPVANTRQVTIDALCEHFANDIMSIEEFERRVDAAHSATSVDALKKLLKNHELSEDDERRALHDVQKVTDEHIQQINALQKLKDAELLER